MDPMGWAHGLTDHYALGPSLAEAFSGDEVHDQGPARVWQAANMLHQQEASSRSLQFPSQSQEQRTAAATSLSGGDCRERKVVGIQTTK